MKLKLAFTLIILSFLGSSSFGQNEFKKIELNEAKPAIVPAGEKFYKGEINYGRSANIESTNFSEKSLSYFQLANIPITVSSKNSNGFPGFFKVQENATLSKNEFLENVSGAMHIKDISSSFLAYKVEDDQLQMRHTRMKQIYNGVEIYGAEIIIHEKENKVKSMNGHYYPSPNIESVIPELSKLDAEGIAKSTFENFVPLHDELLTKLKMEQFDSKLVIYHVNNKIDQERLAWHVTLHPIATDRWELFVDAIDGTILHKMQSICKFHGLHDFSHVKENSEISKCHNKHIKVEEVTLKKDHTLFDPSTSNAADLFNTLRLINVYQTGGTFFLIDASRDMYDANLSNLPDEPAGAIWTIDASNTNPSNDDFNVSHVTSINNSWSTAATGVSAHYNAGQSYEYFKNTFGRNSINGNGGNVISLINVVDEDNNDMDNAFWNGSAMFYGNGDVAFEPLARALDVAGHEISHGVVQATANLEYQGESGAMNESFADIFGAMIDRDDWRMGETVARTNTFPSGALRDLSDPHNGQANQDFRSGWQPRHYNERFTGSQDNGGVHINSGIPNYAYYLFATANGMNKEKAEQIYYRALTMYLTRSSQFQNLRNAVVQSATDIHGENSLEVNAANSAFDAVGIAPSQSGSSGNGEQDLEVNAGSDLVIFSDEARDVLKIMDGTGQILSSQFSQTNTISKPSVRDNGTEIVFVGDDNNVHYIFFNPNTSSFEEQLLLTHLGDGFWRSVVISKDGNRIAAISQTLDNKLYLFDWSTGNRQDRVFELYNPTFSEGVSTGNVLYSDAMEFDHAGEFVMYDALNSLRSNSGDDIETWDISFIKVWDRFTNNWGDGRVSKMFTQLPENVSVGNPTFSENSTYIIAFDYLEQGFFGTDYEVRAANIERGTVNTVLTNGILSYPSYSRLDDAIIFDANNTSDARILGRIPLSADKMTPSGDAIQFQSDARWGDWFSNGERNLYVNTNDLAKQLNVKVYPNPSVLRIKYELNIERKEDALVQLYDMNAKLIYQEEVQLNAGFNNNQINLANFNAGVFYLKITISEGVLSFPIIKIKE